MVSFQAREILPWDLLLLLSPQLSCWARLIGSTSALSSALDSDFVTWRGHLTKLLTTPYETREGWLLAVTRFRGTLYISEVETEVAQRERENRTEKHEEMMYWGYKFEQYTCAGM